MIHLSLLEDEPRCGYLELIGDGIKIFGDMRHSNVADLSVDMIHITASSIYKGVVEDSIKDFDRVLKPGGIVSLESYGQRFAERANWEKLLSLFENYQQVQLPPKFKTGQVRFGIKPQERDPELGGFNGWYVKSEQEMFDFIFSHRGQGFSGFEEILDYAVLRKP